MLWTEDPTQNLREGRSALWNVEQWRSQSQSFADMATIDTVSKTLTGADGGGTDLRRQHLAQPAFTPRRSARARTQLFDRGSRAAATPGPDQSSFLASAFRRLERCDGHDHRARRGSFPDHRHPHCRFPDREARCRRVGAAHDVRGLGNPPQRGWRRHVVRRWKTSTGRDVRPCPGGDERNCPPPERSVAGGRKEPGHQRRSIEPSHGRIPIAVCRFESLSPSQLTRTHTCIYLVERKLHAKPYSRWPFHGCERAVDATTSRVRQRVEGFLTRQNLNVTPTVKRRNFSSLTSRAAAAAVASSFRIARK